MVAKFVSTAALIAMVAAGSATAQTGRTPAEMPPASYDQSQYVDSAGCVFIRAGFNGATTWVPRYGDDRRPMCGFAPSAATGAAQVAAAPMPAPVTVTAAAPAPARAAPRPAMVAEAPRTRRPYSVAPETQRVRVQAAPAPEARVYQAQSGLDTRWSHYDRTGPSPCTNYSPHSQMYAVPSPALPNLPLRCGPQAQHPADALREQSPRGNVWEPWDGANPYPAHNNNVYMLPRPYAPRWPQPYLQGASEPRGTVIPSTRAPRATVSTMGTTAEIDRAPVRAATSGGMSNGRFVQVGTYGVASNAQAAIARLQAQGLPVARGNATSGGRSLQVVLAGPFNSQAELNAALGAARAMGYSDAYVR